MKTRCADVDCCCVCLCALWKRGGEASAFVSVSAALRRAGQWPHRRNCKRRIPPPRGWMQSIPSAPRRAPRRQRPSSPKKETLCLAQAVCTTVNKQAQRLSLPSASPCTSFRNAKIASQQSGVSASVVSLAVTLRRSCPPSISQNVAASAALCSACIFQTLEMHATISNTPRRRMQPRHPVRGLSPGRAWAVSRVAGAAGVSKMPFLCFSESVETHRSSSALEGARHAASPRGVCRLGPILTKTPWRLWKSKENNSDDSLRRVFASFASRRSLCL